MIDTAFERLHLNGRAIIITGGASGIGRATALLAASRGASIVIADIDGDRAETVAVEIEDAGGRAAWRRTDVSEESDVRSMVMLAIERFGGLDGAVNCAALQGRQIPLPTMSLETWQRMIAINLTGTFLCMKHEISAMRDRGGGSIVNVASGAGLVGVPNLADYVASKHGVVGLTRSAAAECGTQGIRVNVVCPGAVDTPMMQSAMRESSQIQSAVASRPMARIADPVEIAEAAAWLLSDASSYATGAVFAIDGGNTCV